MLGQLITGHVVSGQTAGEGDLLPIYWASYGNSPTIGSDYLCLESELNIGMRFN